MSERATRILVGVCLILVVAGGALVYRGDQLAGDAVDQLREGSFRSVGRTRALDQLTGGGRIDPRTFSNWRREADSAAEREVIEALARCFDEDDGTCDDEVEAAREHYAAALERCWADAESQRERSSWMLALAVLSFLAASLGGIYGARRASARAATEEPDAGNPAVEALLRKRLEELYAARLRAWESDRFAAYGELAAGLSHGLKTPLASIRAAAQVAVRRLGDEHPATPQLRDVIAEVDNLVEQVKRFLAATGAGEPVPARVKPLQLVEAIESGYEAEAKERGVRLDCDVADELDEVLVDAALLEMALRNLVENALSVAPEGSAVRVSAGWTDPPSRVGLDDAPPGEGRWIEIVVADEGPGIPSEVLDSGRVESKKPDGSGLGLAIARRIAARHGGALIVDTAPGEGTAVRVVLPAALPETSEAPAAESSEASA